MPALVMSTLCTQATPLRSADNRLQSWCGNAAPHITEYTLRYSALSASTTTKTQLSNTKSVQNVLSKCLIEISEKAKQKTPKSVEFTTQ